MVQSNGGEKASAAQLTTATDGPKTVCDTGTRWRLSVSNGADKSRQPKRDALRVREAERRLQSRGTLRWRYDDPKRRERRCWRWCLQIYHHYSRLRAWVGTPFAAMGEQECRTNGGGGRSFSQDLLGFSVGWFAYFSRVFRGRPASFVELMMVCNLVLASWLNGLGVCLFFTGEELRRTIAKRWKSYRLPS